MPKANIDLDNLQTDYETTATDLNTNFNSLPVLYLDPESLIDAENVRPGETKDDHGKRVKALIGQILDDGQRQPVTVREMPDQGDGPRMQVVDGQGRVDALRIINRARKSEGHDDLFTVWCVLDTSADSWASAVKLNVQRKNYTDLQLAALIADARIRYKWTSKGGEKKLAEFFGITPQLLVEYNSLAALPPDVRDQLAAGELSRSAALKLIQVASDDEQKRAEVMKKAKVLSQEEIDRKQAEVTRKYEASRKKLKEAQAANGKVEPKPAKEKATTRPEKPIVPAPASKPVKVQAQHVAEAARQQAEESGEKQAPIKRNRTEILAAIAQLGEFSPDTSSGKLGKSFANGVQRFADGDFSPKQLQNRWNTMLGIERGEKAEKVEKTEKAAPKK